jgi:hypothetical protein
MISEEIFEKINEVEEKNLIILDLSHCKMSTNACKSLKTSISKNTIINYLNLSGFTFLKLNLDNLIGANACVFISEIIQTHPSIIELELWV